MCSVQCAERQSLDHYELTTCVLIVKGNMQFLYLRYILKLQSVHKRSKTNGEISIFCRRLKTQFERCNTTKHLLKHLINNLFIYYYVSCFALIISFIFGI